MTSVERISLLPCHCESSILPIHSAHTASRVSLRIGTSGHGNLGFLTVPEQNLNIAYCAKQKILLPYWQDGYNPQNLYR